MYEHCTTITTSKGDLKVFDLTVGYLDGIETGTIKDNSFNIALDATELTKEELLTYRKGDLTLIAKTALRLTYPEAYDENGELKQIPDDNSVKKKV